ncbi:gp226 [Synechococcus phage S-CBM2]|nr:gp226 [Synechococcus phage S-CBM2]
MNVLKQNCDPSDGEDRGLPYTCYLVWYEVDGVMTYDLVIPDKKVEIFDYYWDRYREDFKGFKQSEGRVNPKLWQDPRKVEKKKK